MSDEANETGTGVAQAAPLLVEPAPAVEAAAPVAQPSPEPSAKAARADAIVEAWLNDHIRNSPCSRDTPTWNHLLGVLPALKASIAQEL